MVPLIINPIYTLYSGYLLGFMGYIPFSRAPWGVKQLGYHHFPYDIYIYVISTYVYIYIYIEIDVAARSAIQRNILSASFQVVLHKLFYVYTYVYVFFVFHVFSTQDESKLLVSRRKA